jgi:hypothetical protein
MLLHTVAMEPFPHHRKADSRTLCVVAVEGPVL